MAGAESAAVPARPTIAVAVVIERERAPNRYEDWRFRVVDVVQKTDDCPMDVDTYYSMRSSFSGSGSTICMDVDWVVGSCMSIDPENGRDPVRVDCNDRAVPDRQRATQIMREVANVDQCATGIGYAYDVRQFTVCVEDVS